MSKKALLKKTINKAKVSQENKIRVRNIYSILDIPINSTNKERLLAEAEEKIQKKERFLIVTPNPEIVVKAQNDPVLHTILKNAEFSVPDGVGLTLMLRLKASLQATTLSENENTPPQSSVLHSSKRPAAHSKIERITGVDLMEELVKLASKRSWRVFLLGGKSGVAHTTALRLSHNCQLPIANFQWDSGSWLDEEGKPINEKEQKTNAAALKKITAFKPQLLFVGFGAPKQEKWIASNYNKIDANAIMTVGGAFDYISGRVIRAPRWVRSFGLEWFFRLFVEPWRWRRQTGLIKFMCLVIKQRLTGR